MNQHHRAFLLLFTLFPLLYSWFHSALPKITTHRTYTAQRGFFSHDDDPESWELRATTRTNLGLLNRSYPGDTVPDEPDVQQELQQWQRFRRYIEELNASDKDKHYKLLYLVRHGLGLHNVKEADYGRSE